MTTDKTLGETPDEQLTLSAGRTVRDSTAAPFRSCCWLRSSTMSPTVNSPSTTAS
ncbi:hypothetical protein [Haloarcula pelagica]|uniref:hypothetical protein n=1 Tax=Halomicroarcula sp. GCM10025709 TaxID=3252669 RepID=UPI0036D2373E